MGESLIVRKGSKSAGELKNLKIKIYTKNDNFVVPKTGSYMVRLFGGGGWGSQQGGGGSGWMNNGIINLSKGDIIPITIGQANAGKAGGTTFFGSYLSANGGETAKADDGGNGGAGGGGGLSFKNGGIGYQFGGGGGGGANVCGWKNNTYYGGSGGNGGMWGGGGGCSGYGLAGNRQMQSIIYAGNYGIGGLYGGNGGTGEINAINGVNTIGLGLEYEGYGIAGTHEETVTWYEYQKSISGGGGGGGYGGNGGRGLKGECSSNRYGWTMFKGGGGGGGYGCNGGDSAYGYSDWGSAGGGGGGYGCNGGDSSGHGGGGGGGYGPEGYGKGGDATIDSDQMNPAKSGICIIQYIV